ncbi:MAG: hypothetical protein ACLFVE_02850 [Chitinispirillaceae bacterium]
MWTILLWILIAFALLVLLFLLAPMRLDLAATCEKTKCDAEIFFSYLHPLLFSFCYSSKEASPRVRIFGKLMKRSEAETQEQEESLAREAAAQEMSDAATEQNEECEEGVAEVSDEQEPSLEHYAEDENESSGEEGELEGEKVVFFERIRKSRLYRFARNKKWRKKIVAWLGRVGRSFCRFIRFDFFMLHFRLGLKDPALLGKLYGYLAAFRSALEMRNRSVDLSMETVFMQDLVEFETRVRFRTSVYRILAPFMVALFTMPYLSTYRLWRGGERDGKKSASEPSGRK